METEEGANPLGASLHAGSGLHLYGGWLLFLSPTTSQCVFAPSYTMGGKSESGKGSHQHESYK